MSENCRTFANIYEESMWKDEVSDKLVKNLLLKLLNFSINFLNSELSKTFMKTLNLPKLVIFSSTSVGMFIEFTTEKLKISTFNELLTNARHTLRHYKNSTHLTQTNFNEFLLPCNERFRNERRTFLIKKHQKTIFS